MKSRLVYKYPENTVKAGIPLTGLSVVIHADNQLHMDAEIQRYQQQLAKFGRVKVEDMTFTVEAVEG